MRCALDVREAERGHVLHHDRERHEVQDEEGRGVLHGEAGDGRKLHQLLRRVPGARERPELSGGDHDDKHPHAADDAPVSSTAPAMSP